MMFDPENASATGFKLGAARLVEDAAGTLLLDLRRGCELWSWPGGRVETGESDEPGALWESREETGFEARRTGLPGVYRDDLW
jgi:ADP-ribose pyrophosphatase YjhB (NUDIX family)